MACYHPMHCAFQGTSSAGTPQYKILGPWTGVKNHPNDIKVPCGHCIGCRLDMSREWADRMMLELDHSKTAVFLTLTYDNDHVPISMINDDGVPYYTLDKRHVQLFLKRLRQYVRKHVCNKKLRFYLAGEYGDSTSRPHYHAIIFGLDLSDFPDCIHFGNNQFGQPYYTSSILERIWSHGFVSVAPVSWQTCAYVSRYVTKKLTGPDAMVYEFRNCAPPFALMSRRPGIGGYYVIDHPDLLCDRMQYITDFNGVRNVKKVPTPKYIFGKLSFTNPDLYDKIKADRARYASDKQLLELSKTDLDCVEYDGVKERKALSSASALKRPL